VEALVDGYRRRECGRSGTLDVAQPAAHHATVIDKQVEDRDQRTPEDRTRRARLADHTHQRRPAALFALLVSHVMGDMLLQSEPAD
jgi:hypothetical protein